MARINSLSVDDKEMSVTLKLSKEEYEELKHGGKYLSVLPVRDERLSEKLTIGTIGNSYRIMLPKKLLSKHNIPEDELPKRAPAGMFTIGNEQFLVVQLKKRLPGHRIFGENK